MQLTKSEISKLVKIKKANTFWNHFLYAFKKEYKINGEIKKSTIKVWQRTSMTGAFYPVYTFEFNFENQLIKTTDKLNPFAQLFRLLFPFTYFFPILSTSFTDFEFVRFFVGISIFLILTFACYLVSNEIYKYEKKEQLKEFYKTLGDKTKEETEKEWTRDKILTRLFTYPFCFALILVNIFLLLPEGEFFITIPTLGIVGVYLYSDLKIIFKQR